MFEIEVVRFDAQDVIATSACTNTTVTHVFFENGKGTMYTYTNGDWVKKSGYTIAPPTDEPVNGWYELGNSWIVKGGVLQGACQGIEIAQ